MSNEEKYISSDLNVNGELVLNLFEKMDDSIRLNQTTSAPQEVFELSVSHNGTIDNLKEKNSGEYIVSPNKNTITEEQVVKGTISNDNLLNLIHLLVHYRYMVNFLNRNILIGGVRTLLNTAVPNFKSDLRSVDAHFDHLIRTMPMLCQITTNMKQYHIDFDQQYVSYDGRIGKINWEKARKKTTLEHPKLKREAIIPSIETSEVGIDGRKDENAEELTSDNKTSQIFSSSSTIKRANCCNKHHQPTKRVKTHNKGTSTRPIPRSRTSVDTNTLLKTPDYRCSYHGCRFRSNFSMEEVKSHEDRCHVNANLLNCHHIGCFHLFQSEQELQEHMDQYHTPQFSTELDHDPNNDAFACPLDWCSDTFPSA